LGRKSKSEFTGPRFGPAVLAAVLVGAALSTPFYGFGPVLVVTGGLLAAGWLVRKVGGRKGR
jgi:hypothetical protein